MEQEKAHIIDSKQSIQPALAVEGDSQEKKEAFKNEKAYHNGNGAATQNDEMEESIVYPGGIQFSLMSISLCLCVFLVGLVSPTF